VSSNASAFSNKATVTFAVRTGLFLLISKKRIAKNIVEV